MFKYEKLFARNENSSFATARDFGDWKECFKWYKNHKFLKGNFEDWASYLLTQSVKYVQEQWEFYCKYSLEELAFGVTYTKAELLA